MFSHCKFPNFQVNALLTIYINGALDKAEAIMVSAAGADRVEKGETSKEERD